MTIRPDFRFFERLRVRWAEVDLQKIVFIGHCLMHAYPVSSQGHYRW